MIKDFAIKNEDGVLCTLRELCRIPAPSHHEEKRAEYCVKKLESFGAEGVYTDEAKNVVFPLNCEGKNAITAVTAHTDTVFPDTEPMPFSEDEKYMRCPGVGDDTSSVAVLLHVAKFYLENKIVPEDGILFIFNSCEEGLGNLKGTKKIFSDYAGRIKRYISIDSGLDRITDNCVGSERYSVTVKTEGGHSFQKFGNKNAIHALSEIINEIYSIEVPHDGESRTTYNVGTVEGGTSVNTIAQEAKMLCEYRSDSKKCLAVMREHFQDIFARANTEKVKVEAEMIGVRPCAGDVDRKKIEELIEKCQAAHREVRGTDCSLGISSTDCNIPLSLGIPALCIGIQHGGGTHTREEYIEKDTLVQGLEYAIRAILSITED